MANLHFVYKTQDGYVLVHSSSAKQNGSVVSGSVLAKLFSDYDQVVRPGYGGKAISMRSREIITFTTLVNARIQFIHFG